LLVIRAGWRLIETGINHKKPKHQKKYGKHKHIKKLSLKSPSQERHEHMITLKIQKIKWFFLANFLGT
jgi:hypothetical protein